MKKVLFGLALFAISAAANAVQVYLVSIKTSSSGTSITTWFTNGEHPAHPTASTAVWDWDGTNLSSTGILAASSAISSLTSTATILADIVTDLSLDTSGTGTASGATAYLCQEGSFLSGVGASGCGGYVLNTGGDESTTIWSGLSVTQTIGGDDTSTSGPRAWTDAYDGLALINWDGTDLLIGNTALTGQPLGTQGAFEWAFSTVNPAIPVPAAAWLFGSALGLLGWARRRAVK